MNKYKDFLFNLLLIFLSLCLIWLGSQLNSIKYVLFAIAGFMDGMVIAYISGERKPVEKILVSCFYTVFFIIVTYVYIHHTSTPS